MELASSNDDMIREDEQYGQETASAEVTEATMPPAPQSDPEDDLAANWAEAADSTPREVNEGDIRRGVVVAISSSAVHVDIGAKIEGIIPLSEFPSPADLPKVDEEIEVAVVRVDDEHDLIRLSKRRADYERVWNELEALAKEHGVVQAMVTERVKGGLRVDVGVPGFVPASHVGTRNLRSLERFVGRTLRLKVLEADRRSKKVVLSHRELVEEERAKRREETLAKLEEGVICEGKVRSITDYGAFVDLGGVDGLLHVSEMSWTRVKHPSEVVKVGDTVRVVVLDIADGGNRISLGMRQILPDPWKEAAAKLRPNTLVKGRITRIVHTGAFAQLLEEGIEGFIPIRELSSKRISDPSEVIQRDQVVDLKIVDIRREARKMTLSLVAAEEDKERAHYREFMASQVTARPTLGDQFGEVLASVQTSDAPPPEPPAAEPEPPTEAAAPPPTPAAEPEPEPAAAPQPPTPEPQPESEPAPTVAPQPAAVEPTAQPAGHAPAPVAQVDPEPQALQPDAAAAATVTVPEAAPDSDVADS